MTRKRMVSKSVAAEIKALVQAIEDARKELGKVKRKERLASRPSLMAGRGQRG